MKKVLIVGGGISGLTAGIYARQSGFDTTILEMHSIPGGNATGWKRNGYYFEGGMHWLVGSSPTRALNAIWREIGAIGKDTGVHNKDPFLTYIDDSDQKYCLYRDPQKAREHFLSFAPEDAAAINRLYKDVKKLTAVSMPVMDVKGVRTKYPQRPSLSLLFQMMPVFPALKRLHNVSIEEYISQFRHPALRALLGSLVGEVTYDASSLVVTLAGFAAGDGGYLDGGALGTSRRMAKYFKEIGGQLLTNANVEKILVNDKKAQGMIANGDMFLADAVIVATDTLTAIDKLFDPPLKDAWSQTMRQSIKPLACAFLSFGIEANLSDLPETVVFNTDQHFEYAGISSNTILFYNYASYAGYAPAGCSAITAPLMGDTYDFWKAAKENDSYEAEKKKVGDMIVRLIEHRFPQTRGKFAVKDVATPLTYERYCGNYRGSWMSVTEPGAPQMSAQYPIKSPTTGNLYFAGQRLMPPGGFPVAAYTGRAAVQHLCADTDTVFQGDYEKP